MKVPIDIGPITDGLRSISKSMRTIRDAVGLLPQVAETLEEINKGMRFMGKEVHRMRKGVDELGVEVKGMRAAVEPLASQLDIVAERIDALDPRLEDLSLAMHPVRRATGKLGRRRAANGDVVGDAAAEQLDQIESGENVSQADGSPEE